MKFFLVIAIAVVVSVAVSSDEAPPCGNQYRILLGCLSENNMTFQELMKQMPNASSITAEDFKNQCEYNHKYTNLSICLAREYNRCGYGGVAITEEAVSESAKQMDILCNDPKISFDCIAQVSRDTAAKKVCDIQTPPNPDICELTKAQSTCSVEAIKKCDEYTGGVFEQYASVTIAAACKPVTS